MSPTNSTPRWRAALQQRWQAMAPRERLSLATGAAVVGFTLVWLVGVSPAWQALRKAPERQRALDAQLADMQALAAQAQTIRQDGDAQVPARATVIRVIESAAREMGTGTQLSITGSQATLRLGQVAPDLLARQLDQLRRAARVMPVQAQLERVGEGWSGTLTLAGPGLDGQ